MASGNTLGGTGGGSNASPLSAEDVRQRRLAALGGGGRNGSRSNSRRGITRTNTPSQTATSRPDPPIVLPKGKDPPASSSSSLSVPEPMDTTPDRNGNNGVAKSEPTATAAAATTAFDIASFHNIMWDSMVTTDNDKNRWVGQEINTRQDMVDDDVQPRALTTSSSRLETVGQSHVPWGLTQQHGGPCGVLAAIQAEVLRLLLFGRSSTSSMMDYPTELSSSNDRHASVAVTPQILEQALAMAIALVIARASIMPPAYDESSSSRRPTEDEARLVLPSSSNSNTEGLSWNDFEPWSSPSSSTTKSGTLIAHVISSRDHQKGNPKRQRTTDSNNSNNTQHVSREDRIIQLAHVVSARLLEPIGTTETATSTTTNRRIMLDHFRKPGGVLLLVMSLVVSRGVPILEQEFDDPTGTKLTSQFGHCSQELINLLLTGQAVSNVFDNTLQPSGDLTCRGIQSRPACGYLSQLESLRYCEVGGYYKSPKFPIWIVGSSSHFTVLFGDASCLKESKSDVLLEQCRRAFKAMDAESAGFIPTESLRTVLEACGVESEVLDKTATLAASMEVSGAGIILWEDFWKKTSRLLTGASLQAVLQGDDSMVTADRNGDSFDDLPDLEDVMDVESAYRPAKQPAIISSTMPMMITNHAHNEASAATSNNAIAMESDEEMARRLAREWGSDVVASSTPATMNNSNSNLKPSPVAAAASVQIDTNGGNVMLSDEELARKLQAEWAAEDVNSAGAVDGGDDDDRRTGGDDDTVISDLDVEPEDDHKMPALLGGQGGGGGGGGDLLGEIYVREVNDTGGDSKPAAAVAGGGNTALTTASSEQSPAAAAATGLEFERHGDSFPMYHYNGLRGGTLTHFWVSRLTAEEAVGASIALGKAGGGGGTGGMASGGGVGSGNSGDLEDVIRTKWPSCMINWMGKAPPYID